MADQTPVLNVSSSGDGEAVLLLHGFLENHNMWSALSDELPDMYCIAPDLPGHGESDHDPEVRGIDDYAQVLVELLEVLEVDRVHVLGHSMGGYIACALLRKVPEKVASICLVHSTARPDSEEKKQQRLRAIEVAGSDARRYVAGMIPGLFPSHRQGDLEDEIQALVREAQSMEAQAIQAALHAMKDRPDSRPLLLEREIPCVFVLGDCDPLLPIEEGKKEAREVRAERLEILKDTGHMGQLESSNAWVGALKQWLLSVRS